jgi:A118 family predicted phage portal protein
LFTYFRLPQASTIDTSSPLGVSGYSRATSLIKDADRQYSRLLWEYEAGEMAIDIDRDALQFREAGYDRDGKKYGVSVLPTGQQRLFRKVDLGDGQTYQPFAPALRDISYVNGLNTILMRIEDVCAISRGTLSDVTSEAKTATELKILKQRTYSENLEIQNALQQSLDEVIYIMNVYCDLYKITPAGEYDVSYEWDDSIITDVDEELNKRLTLMQQGLTSKLEVRKWYFGETDRQAQEALLQIDEENRQAMEENVAMQQSMSKEEQL